MNIKRIKYIFLSFYLHTLDISKLSFVFCKGQTLETVGVDKVSVFAKLNPVTMVKANANIAKSSIMLLV